MSNDKLWEDWARQVEEADNTPAPSCLKSKLYSSLINAQQQSGPLLGLKQTREQGHKLCVFERFVEMLPQQKDLQSFQYCNICHARVAGEKIENAPIFWPHCPYCEFQNR